MGFDGKIFFLSCVYFVKVNEAVKLVLRTPIVTLFFRWYHGKLDRTIAEERLRQAGKPGSYLIRESDRRPGSFVLSFLSKTNVNHFR